MPGPQPEPQSGPPLHFIVIVPGYMGSLLRDKNTKEPVWIDLPRMMLKLPGSIDRMFDRMTYPDKPGQELEPYAIMETGVLYVLPWARLGHYGRLLQVLKNLGYAIQPENPAPDTLAVYKFPYDWRQDNRTSAKQLGAAIDGWRAKHPNSEVWLIGHSNGGIVSRQYVENEGGKAHVKRLFLMGSPWDGAPKSVKVFMEGMEVVGRQLLNKFGFGTRMRELIRSFPSYYQLIPHVNEFLKDQNNHPIDPYADSAWLESDRDRQYLAQSLQFYKDLDGKYSAETVCFIGTKKRTTTSGVVSVGPGGKWGEVTWGETLAGDGTVPERSAIHPGVKDVYAYWVDHGSIYVDDSMLAQLERELFGKYQGVDRAALMTERLSIVFEPSKVFHAPGETVNLWVTIDSRGAGEPPVSDAQVKVSVAWLDPLPGNDDISAPLGLPETFLQEDPAQPGRYTGQFTAPQQEGFYTLTALVEVSGEPAFSLEESIAVEAQAES